MMVLRKAGERGYAQHGWLESWHSFSFADYNDPAHVHFGPLRVINEDIVQPGTGFGTHGHRDMEILTYVLSGALRHRDSMGSSGDIRYGEVQVMSAGTGCAAQRGESFAGRGGASAANLDHAGSARLDAGLSAKEFSAGRQAGALVSAGFARCGARLVVDPSGCARVCRARLDGAETLDYPMAAGRKAYLHVARGSLQANGYALSAGDALMYTDEAEVELSAAKEAEVLLFDMGLIKIKTAGGRPATSHFSCLAKKSNQKKSPPVCRPCGLDRCCLQRFVRLSLFA